MKILGAFLVHIHTVMRGKEIRGKEVFKDRTDKEAVSGKEKVTVWHLNCADAAIEKTEQLAADVKKHQTDKAERKMGSVDSMKPVNPVELAVVVEPEFRYGAEAFEAHQQETAKEMVKDRATKNVPVKNGKGR